jgi:hypothetical protein
MKFFTTTIICLLLFAACNNDRKAIETLEKATMDLHDEAMKAMGPMNSTARSLRETLKTTDSLSQQYQLIREALAKIEHAEADMMTWMQSYTPPAEDTPAEQALQYLNDQKSKMEQNFKDIKAAAEQGKLLLETKK